MNQAKMSGFSLKVEVIFLLVLGILITAQKSTAQPVFGNIDANDATCGYNSGTIFAPVTGGTEPYTYLLNNVAQASNYFTGLPAGSYNIVVTDSRGLNDRRTVIIRNAGEHPNPQFTVTPPSGCDKLDGTIVASAMDGVGPYTFSVAGATATSATMFSAGIGAYTLLVRGANGCYGSIAVPVTATCASPGVLVSSTPGCPTGSVTARPAGGSLTPFTYSLTGGVNDYGNSSTGIVTITGVTTGTHKLYAKDRSGNIFIYNFTVSSNCVTPLAISAVGSSALCANKDGTITVTVTSPAVSPILYSVVGRPFQISNVLTNLGQGYYTIQVKDAAGHIGEQKNVRVFPNCPTLNVSTTPSSCSGNTGTITVVGTGVGTIEYSIDGTNFTSNPTFTDVAAGTYIVTSRDGNSTVTTASATVSTVPGPSLDRLNVTPTGCTVDNGKVSATETGGLAPFTYQLENGTTNGTGNFGTLAAGLHNIKVSDANGCSDNQDFTIVPTDPPTLALIPVPAGCSVGNGSITANADGGTGNYSYRLGAGPLNTSGLFPDLPAGNYTITVTDENGCTAQQTAVVNTAAGPTITPPTVTPTSCNGNDGVIATDATGGKLPYKFALDNGNIQETGNFTKVDTGAHVLTVTDANGCIINQNVTVTVNNTLVVDAGAPANVCAGQSIKLNGSSNAPATWSPATGLTDPSVLNTAASPAGNTKYYLTAMSGVCTRIDSVIINVIDLPVADAGPDTTICYGDNARLNANGGISFTWTPSSFLDNDHTRSPVVLAPIQTMVYQLSVTDDNGCVSAKPDVVTVRVTPKAVVAAGKDTSVLAGIPFPLHASDVNGSGFSQYSWTPGAGLDNPNAQYPTANLSEGQTFIVTARTPAGCNAQDDITIKVFKEANLFVPNAFTPNNDGINDLLHVIPIGIKDFHYFRIYNRHGELVFNTADAGAGWDGRISGQIPSTGGYVWSAEGIGFDGRLMQRQGNVVLIR